jgi:hypothetical protein
VLFVVIIATGCAAPQFTYVTDGSANTYFKVPYGWHRISDVSLAAQFKTPGFLNAQSGGWDVAYDGDTAPQAIHLFSPAVSSPFAFAFVTPLSASASNSMSYDRLRDVLLPVTSAARTATAHSKTFPLTGFQLLRDTVLTPGQGVHGVWETFNYTYPGGITDTFDQVAFTNADSTQLYVLMVHCTATCYQQNHAQVDNIVSSFTVRSP